MRRELSRFDRRAIRDGRNEAGGKFSKLRAFARFTAMNVREIQPSATQNNAPATDPRRSRCFDDAWNVVETIGNEEARPIV